MRTFLKVTESVTGHNKNLDGSSGEEVGYCLRRRIRTSKPAISTTAMVIIPQIHGWVAGALDGGSGDAGAGSVRKLKVADQSLSVAMREKG